MCSGKKTALTEQQQLAQTEHHGLIVSSGGHADSVARPPQAHIGGRNSVTPPPMPAVVIDEIEQLPLYEAPPPKYERIAKAEEQQPVEMQDLERGESSGTTSGGDNGEASIRRADTDGGYAGEPPPPPPPPPPPEVLFVRRAFSGYGPFSR